MKFPRGRDIFERITWEQVRKEVIREIDEEHPEESREAALVSHTNAVSSGLEVSETAEGAGSGETAKASSQTCAEPSST